MTYQDIVNNCGKNIKYILYTDGTVYKNSEYRNIHFRKELDGNKEDLTLYLTFNNDNVLRMVDNFYLPNHLNVSINYKIKTIEYENSIENTLDDLLKILNYV